MATGFGAGPVGRENDETDARVRTEDGESVCVVAEAIVEPLRMREGVCNSPGAAGSRTLPSHTQT